jgi:type I restriction enzyme S subunit
LPPVAEQRKIAAILGTWDAAIATVEQLIAALQARKQGLMQRLLTGEVRFPEFAGSEWRIKKFSDVFERVTRKNTSGNVNVLTASAQYGLVSQVEYFNRSVAGADLSSYYLLKKGEFAYNRSSSDGYPFGAIKRLEEYDEGILSTLYICFGMKEEAGVAEFYKHYFESGGLNQGIYMIAQEGARNHGLLNVGLSDFFDLDVVTPSIEEQKRIAELFELQDKLIDTNKRRHAAIVQQKQALMQKLITGQVRVSTEDSPSVAFA